MKTLVSSCRRGTDQSRSIHRRSPFFRPVFFYPTFFCLEPLIGQSETDPRGQLEGARATRAEDRTDPVIGLPKSKLTLVRGTTGCALWIGLSRRYRTNVSVQRAAVTGQVRNVEDVEALSDQIEPDLFSNPDASRHAQVVREEAVVILEFVRQNDVRQRRPDGVTLWANRNARQRRVFGRRKRGVVLIHQHPDFISIQVVAE